MSEIADSLRRSTVQVRIDQGRNGQGSGVLWNRAGLVISNAHVVRGSNVEVELDDNRRYAAEVLRRDTRRDLALLQIRESGELPAASWADSSQVKPGEVVLAVGNPLGFIGALSTGVIHSQGPFPGLGEQSWIQADIRLAPGNSGGALANAEGRVIGVNTMIAKGLGLAVPSNEVASFVRRSASTPPSPMLGVSVEPTPFRIGSRLALGLRIQEIMAEGKAAAASLAVGDVIIGVDGKFLNHTADLSDRLARGGVIQLEFLRGGKPVPREVAIALPEYNPDFSEGGQAAAA